MSLAEIIKTLEYKLHIALPGVLAHEPMRATPVGGGALGSAHKIPPRQGSVLILLYEVLMIN